MKDAPHHIAFFVRSILFVPEYNCLRNQGGDQMVHIKVIKGSKLLLCASVVVLIIVIGIIIFSTASKPAAQSHTQADLVHNAVQDNNEAKTETVFASLGMSPESLPFDPGTGITVEIIGSNEAAPSVLIYHTHTHEAYEQVSGDQYVAIEAWRTIDQDHSVVRVGEELASLLRQRGFEVVHDTSDFEQDALGTAYTRSLEALKLHEQRFDLYIDLHRDAYIEGVSKLRYERDGFESAQLMMLIGNGEGFEDKPYYEENYLFAKKLTERINALRPGLCKEVLVKDGRYNQNIGVFSILIEVGHNRNTLSEALQTLPCLSEALYSLLIAQPDSDLTKIQNSFYSD